MDQIPDPERLRRLEEAVLQVPRLNRQIFLAARVDGMSVAEIARQTGLLQRGNHDEKAASIKMRISTF